MTSLYNDIMRTELPKAGIDCVVTPRKAWDGQAVSASAVRQRLRDGDWDALGHLVPSTTLDYFRSPDAADVLARIRAAGELVHC